MSEVTRNTASANDTERFTVLAVRYLANDLAADDASEFRDMLVAEPARCGELSAIALYSRWFSGQLCQELQARHEAAQVSDAIEVASTRQMPVLGFLGRTTSALGRPVFWSVLAAGVLFAAYFVTVSWDMLGKKGSKQSADSGQQVAVISNTEDAEWSPNTRLTGASRNGKSIKSGEPLKIDSGLVELQLKQGTTLLVEGPAEWTIDGDNEATLKRGKLVARIPKQAIGFTLETPTAKIVDLGTEFGVEVSKSSTTEVLVVKGRVDVNPVGGSSAAASTKLQAGEGVQITAEGVHAKTNGALPDKFKRLVEASNQDASGPNAPSTPTTGLVAYYPFDGDTRDHATEYAANSGKTADDLKIVGPSEFLVGQVGRGLRLTGGYGMAPISPDLQLPPTFTIEAWIVAERLANDHQRLVLNWGRDELAYHFGIFGKQVKLFIGQKDSERVSIGGGELKIERWEHVAATADGRLLRVYLNGIEVGSQPYDGTLFVSTTEGLGLGDSAGAELPSSRLHGAIDELAIWNVALSPEQIAFHARPGTRGYALSAKVKTATTSPKIEK